MLGSVAALAADKPPNILVIWGDDIGTWNISHNNRGMMGYQTPNIDRIAKEGVWLHRLLCATELHGRSRRIHQRFSAGPLRRMTKVGLPGAAQAGETDAPWRRYSRVRATPQVSSAKPPG